jgi:hypothetical protein
MVAVRDFLAGEALVAGIDGGAALSHGVQAVEHPGEGARQLLQSAQFMAREQVGMGQAPAFERTLEQLHALRLGGKVFECHREFQFKKGPAGFQRPNRC